jgi:hypothetical protein
MSAPFGSGVDIFRLNVDGEDHRALMSRDRPDRRQSGYSSFRQVRGSGGWGFGVRSSRKL